VSTKQQAVIIKMTLSPDRRYSGSNHHNFNYDDADDTFDDLDESLLVSPAQEATERPLCFQPSVNDAVEDGVQQCTDEKNVGYSIDAADMEPRVGKSNNENSKHSSPLTPASGNNTQSSSESPFSSGIRTPVTSEKFSYAAALEQLEELAPSAAKDPRPTASSATLSPGSTVMTSIFRFPCIRKDNVEEDTDLELRRSCPVHDSREEDEDLECRISVNKCVAEFTSGDGDQLIEQVDGSDDTSLAEVGILEDVSPMETSISSATAATSSIKESNVKLDHCRIDGDEPIPVDGPSISRADEVTTDERNRFSGFPKCLIETGNEHVLDESVACDQATLASSDKGGSLLDNSNRGISETNVQLQSENDFEALEQDVEPTVKWIKQQESVLSGSKQHTSTTQNQPLPGSGIFDDTGPSSGVDGGSNGDLQIGKDQEGVTSCNTLSSNATNRPDDSGLLETPPVSIPIDKGSHHSGIGSLETNNATKNSPGRNHNADIEDSASSNSNDIMTKLISRTVLEKDCDCPNSSVQSGTKEAAHCTVNFTTIAAEAHCMKEAKDGRCSTSGHINPNLPNSSSDSRGSDAAKCSSKQTGRNDTEVKAINDIAGENEDINFRYSRASNGPEVASDSSIIENKSTKTSSLESSRLLKPPIHSLLLSKEPFVLNLADSLSPISKSSSPHNCDIQNSAQLQIVERLDGFIKKNQNIFSGYIIQGNAKAAKHSIFEVLSKPNDAMHDISGTQLPANTIEQDRVVELASGLVGESLLINEIGHDREEENRGLPHHYETLTELTSRYDDYDSNEEGERKRKSLDELSSCQKKYDSTSSEFLKKLRSAAENRKREVTRCRQSLERKELILMEENDILANIPTVQEVRKTQTFKTRISSLPTKKKIEGSDPYKPFRARPVPATVLNPDNKGESGIPFVAKRASTSPGGMLSGSKPKKDSRDSIATNQQKVDGDWSRKSLPQEKDPYIPFRATPLPATIYSGNNTTRLSKPSSYSLGAKRDSIPRQSKPIVKCSELISKPPKRLISGKEAYALKESKLRTRIQDEEATLKRKSAFQARLIPSDMREQADPNMLLGEILLDSCKENCINKSSISDNADAQKKRRSTKAFIPRSSIRAEERAAYEAQRMKRERESRNAQIRRRKELIDKTAAEIEKLKDSI